jgi:uncharacterized protein (DUF1330 family)
MSSYFLAQLKIHDPQRYEKYLEGFNEIFAKYKGKVIAADDGPTVLEGEWSYSRVVIIQFPNENELKRWYESREYQTLAKYRIKSSQADVIIIKGRD